MTKRELSKGVAVDFDAYGDTNIFIPGPHIVLTDIETHKLAQLYYDGRCPVCNEEINTGAVICDDCYSQAQSYREDGPPVSI